MLARLHEQLAPLHRATPPTAVPREHARGVHWVEPVLVAEVAYRNWTPDGRLRHPSWRGLRVDRQPQEAIRQPDEPPAASGLRPGTPSPRVAGAMQTSDGRWRVEVVDNGSARWYRLVHDETTVDWLSLSDVERLLDRAGIDMGQLHDAGNAA
jgi:bifunctional non-homologous end joining protein LigD